MRMKRWMRNWQHPILRVKKYFSCRAYRMNRCTNYCGHFIRHGLWYPDPKVRLFDRRCARWAGMNPHDKIEIDNHFAVGRLEGRHTALFIYNT
jgi:hypothetical protein